MHPSIKNNILDFQKELAGTNGKLIAISKTKPPAHILEAYEMGLRSFGENKVQEMVSKYEVLPKDIEWHMVGHLQTNKVKYIIPFVHLIHSVDSLKLLKEINKQAEKNKRLIRCLLQVNISQEENKFGFEEKELMAIINSDELKNMRFIQVAGLMGMATNTKEESVIRKEFRDLKNLFERIKHTSDSRQIAMQTLSMGMSNDYKVALEEGSTMIRVGSAIFGSRMQGQ